MPAAISVLLASVGVGDQPTLLVREHSLPVVLALLGLLLLATLAIRRFSLRFGAPSILGVLLFGLLVPNRFHFFDPTTIANLHTVGLAMLLFYAGLQTRLRAIRGFLEYGVVLAIGGVAVSATVLGLLIWAALAVAPAWIQPASAPVSLGLAMLIAACLASTDAGATLSVLQEVRDRVPVRLRHLLEFESSLNDPAAILFLGLVAGLASGDGTGTGRLLLGEARLFVQSIGSGMLIGVVLGYLCRFCLNRLVEQREQLLIFSIAFAAIAYGGATGLGGSGFIAAYVTGLFLSNHTYENPEINPAALRDVLAPFNTMVEVVVFLAFGLSTDPAQLLPMVPAGIVVALGLMLVARPLSVLLFQPLSPFSRRESLLVAWCGLRGAVPLALAQEMLHVVPDLAGLASSRGALLAAHLEGIVFTAVVLNLLLQGLSLPWVCRRLGLQGEPAAGDHPAALLP